MTDRRARMEALLARNDSAGIVALAREGLEQATAPEERAYLTCLLGVGLCDLGRGREGVAALHDSWETDERSDGRAPALRHRAHHAAILSLADLTKRGELDDTALSRCLILRHAEAGLEAARRAGLPVQRESVALMREFVERLPASGWLANVDGLRRFLKRVADDTLDSEPRHAIHGFLAGDLGLAREAAEDDDVRRQGLEGIRRFFDEWHVGFEHLHARETWLDLARYLMNGWLPDDLRAYFAGRVPASGGASSPGASSKSAAATKAGGCLGGLLAILAAACSVAAWP